MSSMVGSAMGATLPRGVRVVSAMAGVRPRPWPVRTWPPGPAAIVRGRASPHPPRRPAARHRPVLELQLHGRQVRADARVGAAHLLVGALRDRRRDLLQLHVRARGDAARAAPRRPAARRRGDARDLAEPGHVRLLGAAHDGVDRRAPLRDAADLRRARLPRVRPRACSACGTGWPPSSRSSASGSSRPARRAASSGTSAASRWGSSPRRPGPRTRWRWGRSCAATRPTASARSS